MDIPAILAHLHQQETLIEHAKSALSALAELQGATQWPLALPSSNGHARTKRKTKRKTKRAAKRKTKRATKRTDDSLARFEPLATRPADDALLTRARAAARQRRAEARALGIKPGSRIPRKRSGAQLAALARARETRLAKLRARTLTGKAAAPKRHGGGSAPVIPVYILEALRDAKQPLSMRALTELMLAKGWTTKSTAPATLVGVTVPKMLRAKQLKAFGAKPHRLLGLPQWSNAVHARAAYERAQQRETADGGTV